MYAGTTIRHGSGRFVGVHQRIDRAARRHLKYILPKTIDFPVIKDILYFEGNNGPDGLKRKSPGMDQTWYFIDPEKTDDCNLIVVINDHIVNLTNAISMDDNIRASFEAAWLAHAIVDGLTPAHHYPLSDKIEQLWGKSHDERNSIFDKNVIQGAGLRDTLSKNWEYWGPGGVFTTHGMFEMGVASAIATENFKEYKVTSKDINELKKDGFEKVFVDSLKKVSNLKMYDELAISGWTQRLAKKTKQVLVPEIVRVVTLAWYYAAINSKAVIK